LSPQDGSKGLPTVSIEHFYRKIPLEAGKTYTTRYRTAGGGHSSYEFEAREGDSYSVSHRDVEDIWNMTDEEILAAGDRVHGGCRLLAHDHEKYQAGYVDERERYRNEATGDPRIIRQLQAPMRCYDVTERTQIGFGSSFQIADSGDKIIFDERNSRLLIISKEDIDSGQIRLVPVDVGHDEVALRQQRMRATYKPRRPQP
jgi:hypothetical protein